MSRAADGRFPPVDGLAELLPPDAAGTHAVVEFTGHAYLLTDREPALLLPLRPDGFGGAMQPAVLAALAGAAGSIGSLDVVLVRRGASLGARSRSPATRNDLDGHPRVCRAREHRRDVAVFGDERGLVCIGRGLVDRVEISVELTGAAPGLRAGRELVLAALAHVPHDVAVFAQVAAGNAASLRMFLACGFVPIGSEVLIRPCAS